MLIIEDIIDYLKSGEKNSKKIGLEIEHFVIDSNGNQIGFDKVTSLIEEVATRKNAKKYITDGHIVGYDTGEYTVTLEPACQFEVSIYPRDDLNEIQEIYKDFYNEWSGIFSEIGYEIITSGNLPNVELGIVHPDEIPLSPKLRYKYMDQYFKKSGKYGKYMMRASGSTQLSIDYESEADMVRKLHLLEIISPILMIMMENKQKEDSTLPGGAQKKHLLRIQEWEDLDPARTGYFPNSFDDNFGYEMIANTIIHTPLILLSDKGNSIYVDEKNAVDVINDGLLDYNERGKEDRISLIEHFISMGFFHYRIKKYIEIRIADAVPIDKSIAFAALIKGLMYHEASLQKLESLFGSVSQIKDIQEATDAVEVDGLDATIYDKTALEWANIIVDIAYDAIDNDERKYLKLLRR